MIYKHIFLIISLSGFALHFNYSRFMDESFCLKNKASEIIPDIRSLDNL